jgi:hypothetical protein
MEKFDSSRHAALLKKLPFSYFSTSVYADFSHHIFERNGEQLIVWQDNLYPNEFPCVFPPQLENNWERCSVTFAQRDFIENAKKRGVEVLIEKPAGAEFFYTTTSFIEPHGSIERDVELFKRAYPAHEVHTSCESETIVDFYNEWRAQKTRDGETFDESEEFFDFCLQDLEKYDVRQTYVFVDGNLAGLAWGVPHSHGKWVGLHLKVRYEYKGLSRYLHHLRAHQFPDHAEFSLGTGAHEPGIEKHKRDLHPSRETPYFYVLTGERS